MEAIFEFVSDKSFQDYEQERMLRPAIEREFVLIGEAVIKEGLSTLLDEVNILLDRP